MRSLVFHVTTPTSTLGRVAGSEDAVSVTWLLGSDHGSAVRISPVQVAASVVVATHNRAHLLGRLIAALERQEGGGSFEVVVVDDASTDDTCEVVERLATTSRVPLKALRVAHHSGPATARNVGWRAASGEVIAFTDDDCVPQPGWLAALTTHVIDSDIVQGRTLPDPAQAPRLGPFSHTMLVTGEDGFYQTCNVAYRRGVLERVSGFDERYRHAYGEDVDLAWRAKDTGATSAFAADAVVHHDVTPSSLVDHVRRTKRLENVVLAVRGHPRARSYCYRRWFYQSSHPAALLALSGIAVATAPRVPRPWRTAGIACVLPYLRLRTVVNPLRVRRRYRLAVTPLALVADLAEIAVLAKASVRHRTLLL